MSSREGLWLQFRNIGDQLALSTLRALPGKLQGQLVGRGNRRALRSLTKNRFSSHLQDPRSQVGMSFLLLDG